MILLTPNAPACSKCMTIAHHRIHHHKSKHHKWVIDSGASVHCICDPSLLTSIHYKHPPVVIKVADNRTLSAQAVGTVILPLHDTHGRTHHITLHNVIYHPNFHTNLLSVRRLWLDNHIMCRFDPHNYLHDSSGVRFPIAYDRKLSSDLCGPFPKSLDNSIYMLNVVDAHTNYLMLCRNTRMILLTPN